MHCTLSPRGGRHEGSREVRQPQAPNFMASTCPLTLEADLSPPPKSPPLFPPNWSPAPPSQLLGLPCPQGHPALHGLVSCPSRRHASSADFSRRRRYRGSTWEPRCGDHPKGDRGYYFFLSYLIKLSFQLRVNDAGCLS